MQFTLQGERSSLRDFHATDDFDDERRRLLPESAVLVLVTPESVFRHWDGEAVEGIRPDITLVPVPFLGYGETGRVLAARMPLVAPLIEHYLREERLDVGFLRALARRRTVLVEADALETVALLPYLSPSGAFYRVMPDGPRAEDITKGIARRTQHYARLYAALGEQARDPETARKLLWIHYTDALYYAFHGRLGEARTSVRQGLSLAPGTRELARLSRALQGAPDGPLDIRPFLVGESG